MVRCGLERRYQNVKLCSPMNTPVFVVCDNTLGLHGSQDLVSYIFYGEGFSIDDPTYEEAKQILEYYEYTKIDTITRTCLHCRQLLGGETHLVW